MVEQAGLDDLPMMNEHIVVIHGIGSQLLSETIRVAARRFGEARMSSVLRSICFAFAALSCGCTSLTEIRTHHGSGEDTPIIDALNPSNGCGNVGSTATTRANSIEDYKDYWAGYTEFDDEGWLYNAGGQPSQMEVVQKRLKRELNDPVFAETDFLIVAFVHGWHHNAHDNDCNVHEFRAMLKIANDQYAAATRLDTKIRHRRIIGVYAAWRGESIDSEILSVTTVIDRRNAAERVAKGDVRELFAQLRKLQIGESQKPNSRSDRMRTVVVGHSFGGLIAFHGLSPAVLNELTLTKPEEGAAGCKPTISRPSAIILRKDRIEKSESLSLEHDKTPPVFPDMLILINPAFEATRFEALHTLMKPSDGCRYPEDRPKVVVLTADNDSATGPIFTLGRRVLTLLEAYPSDSESNVHAREKEANIHAIGFTDRYRTHRLCLISDENGTKRAVAVLTPPTQADWSEPDPYAPVWVVRAPKEIINGHNGFFFAARDPDMGKQEPYLLNWLVGLHLYGPGEDSPVMAPANSCREQ
ncbi:hypothetical protein ACO0LO_22240 [Undibacterium sp. TJN25]|uniref:hypothetical protein n=1 Tax=Undibacterium sp. TJN25 TaxID=3413056 RepID=UPI003BEFA945